MPSDLIRYVGQSRSHDFCRPSDVNLTLHASPRWEEDREYRSRPMEIERSRCVHAVPPIAKDCDHPRSASDRDRLRPSDEDLMKIRSRPRSTRIKSRWKLDASDASTCHHVSPLIAFTYTLFCRTWWFDDRVDSGLDQIWRLSCVHVACKWQETCGI